LIELMVLIVSFRDRRVENPWLRTLPFRSLFSQTALRWTQIMQDQFPDRSTGTAFQPRSMNGTCSLALTPDRAFKAEGNSRMEKLLVSRTGHCRKYTTKSCLSVVGALKIVYFGVAYPGRSWRKDIASLMLPLPSGLTSDDSVQTGGCKMSMS
jgi:hypothetical protein